MSTGRVPQSDDTALGAPEEAIAMAEPDQSPAAWAGRRRGPGEARPGSRPARDLAMGDGDGELSWDEPCNAFSDWNRERSPAVSTDY